MDLTNFRFLKISWKMTDSYSNGYDFLDDRWKTVECYAKIIESSVLLRLGFISCLTSVDYYWMQSIIANDSEYLYCI